jgi:protoporphyrinogen oxidase
LGGVALLGFTPLYSQLSAVPGVDANRRWTGDDFEEAHGLLRNPYAVLRYYKERIDHPAPGAEPFDTVVVGGGIAGLAVAYKLRGRRVVLLERERETGGVSKSENWSGIEYSIGAAYMIDPKPDPEEPGSREAQNQSLLNELGIYREGRIAQGDDNHCVFTNDRIVPHEEVYSEENTQFFEHVLSHDNFPAVPPEDPELVQRLDRVSFKRFLQDAQLQQHIYGRQVGAISQNGWEAIEYYFWGAFGTNSWETSAYHGLNFFAPEFDDILVFPGGNAYIAKRLTRRLREHSPDIVQTGAYVLQIDPGENETWTVLVYRQGAIHRYRTRTVVFSSPVFLAKRMIPSLPDDQRRVIESLDYRSYVVANVLLRRRLDAVFEEPGMRNGYELTRIHNLDPGRYLPDQISNRGVYSDVVVADFAVQRAPQYGVLTVYRPYPYAHGRDRLRYLSYGNVEAEIRAAVLEGFAHHGLRENDIEGIRLTRWGHPMIIPRPGQLADGIMDQVRRPLRNSLFFAHTDIQGAPAIENALAAAFDAVDAVESVLG